MRPTDRARLTSALRDHVARIATDLRGKLRAEGPLRVRAKQLHSDEQVGEDFDVWTDLLSRRAAVLWVLKSVYVRVLEDKGLLSPGRILDPEAQQLFERLAPNLGESAFLRWVYRDLASPRGGLPELFAPQPAEIATPSDEHSRALLTFWRHRDPDSGACWSFAAERFEGELMGDLYQELDPVVKDRFALCQTPDFVRAFILDRTLTPALETFGAETVRLLDPACGSGHFLIDGLKRLVVATGEKHPEWDKEKLVRHCLNRVVGIDLNDYACALARARLVMTAAELAGVSSLAKASEFHPHVYWADGLEQMERGQDTREQQLDLLDPKRNEAPRASLTRPEVRAALGKELEPKFHAVVANPPYITEKDEARRTYHREKVGSKKRYISAYREYSLGAPFTERAFQLSVSDGFVGLITSTNFMKREFGKPLIETVLSQFNLTLVVDTSQVFIPFHDTPTVLLFARNSSPTNMPIRAVMSKRGETGIPEIPGQGKVWSSIVAGWNSPGFENEFISVADLPRSVFGNHPWSLQGGGALQVKEHIESTATSCLRDVVEEIGFVCMTRADDIYFVPSGALLRAGIDPRFIIENIEGDRVRDWTINDPSTTLFPYDEELNPVSEADAPAVHRFLWPYRSLLWLRREPNGNHRELGLTWWEWSRFQRERFRAPLSLCFASISSDNHFAFDRGARAFKQSAPVIKLPPTALEDDYFALLGLLNSSTACFWMKQVSYPKGSRSKDLDKDGTLPENNRYDFSSTAMLSFPLPPTWRTSNLARLAREIDALARQRQQLLPSRVLGRPSSLSGAEGLRAEFELACRQESALRRKMVYLQEEIDWLVYELYQLHSSDEKWVEAALEIDPENRPFCSETHETFAEIPAVLRSRYKTRRASIEASARLALIETPVFKRLWRGTQGVFGRYDRTYDEKAQTAMLEWLANRVESVVKDRGRPVSVEQVVSLLQGDPQTLTVIEVLAGRRDFSLHNVFRALLQEEAIPLNHFHVYTETGCIKRSIWERTWEGQRREDLGEQARIEVPPQYSQGDFLRSEYWQLRGKLDVPKERFIAFTEVPGRDANNTLYGWAGWTPLQRLKALLTIDEELEDAGVPLADRIGVLDSAWRLLPDVAREDAAAASNLKAELQALVGPDGPSREQLDDWRQRFPPPGTKAARTAEKTAKKKKS